MLLNEVHMDNFAVVHLVSSTKNQIFEKKILGIFYPVPMRFAVEGVCVMRYRGPMRYAMHFPANQVGGRVRLCVIRGYALSQVSL